MPKHSWGSNFERILQKNSLYPHQALYENQTKSTYQTLCKGLSEVCLCKTLDLVFVA